MDAQQLAEFIRNVGRCEVIYQDDESFIAIPIPEGAMWVNREEHEENIRFFREAFN
ncbi:hypothetical protein SAMN05428958_11622 [Pantoea sesami]|nr:hypothetical protein SAMN05428958_11622 [Pantoea sesami]